MDKSNNTENNEDITQALDGIVQKFPKAADMRVASMVVKAGLDIDRVHSLSGIIDRIESSVRDAAARGVREVTLVRGYDARGLGDMAGVNFEKYMPDKGIFHDLEFDSLMTRLDRKADQESQSWHRYALRRLVVAILESRGYRVHLSSDLSSLHLIWE